MEPAEWTARAGITGPASVVVNGEDITADVEAFGVQSRPGAPPVLAVYMRPGAEANLAGPGIVEVNRAGGIGAAVVDFLQGISSDVLSKEVAERMGWDDSDTFALALRVLIEWAGGAKAAE